MNNVKEDILAGFSVFLLALPLCLGIALASHFPPSAGIITAILGGIITPFFGSTQLTIKGPAAGLIVIALGAVVELGQGDLVLGYERTLAVGVVAALLQIIIGLRKKAAIVEIMPPSVIHGMLTAIGVIIIAKQAYVLIGTRPPKSSIIGLIMDFPMHLSQANPIVLVIGILALCLVVFWPKIKKLSFIPASIAVVTMTIPLSLYFDIKDKHTYHLFHNDYILNNDLLVHLPMNLIHAIHFPDFSYLFSIASTKYIILFALIGSIESLLTVCAIDSITKPSKPADLNKDLLGVGIANLCCSLLGGLPMIAEIVRSKAGIEYGAKTSKTNFFHGVFMLIAALVLTPYINLIPLSALAALLIYVGFRLASPKAFIHVYQIGTDQFLLFMATFTITLMQDLLTGVIAGIVLKLLLHTLRGNNLKHIFKPDVSLEHMADSTKIIVSGPLTFVAYLKLKHIIGQALATNSLVEVDLSNTSFVDHTIMSKLSSLKELYCTTLLVITGGSHLRPLYNHDLSTRKF